MDIKGRSSGPAGELSNFTAHEFIFDGVRCKCSEGPLQAFKFEDLEVQKEICMLSGREAKARGRERNEAWQSSQKLWWQGVEYDRDSYDYQNLLDRLFDALAENKEFKISLLATGAEELTHSIGETDLTKTILTEKEFCQRLMKIRRRIRKEKKIC
jgi:predicted NAD-dependent protein-ADP-ribosyltransferase YbiA (DUF1768 family)